MFVHDTEMFHLTFARHMPDTVFY